MVISFGGVIVEFDKKRTIIVDSNSICFRLKFALADTQLSTAELETGIIYGFLIQIKKLANRFNTNKFIFTWDVGGSLRRDIYPPYKMNRKKKSKVENEDYIQKEFNQSCFLQFNLLRTKILPELGFLNIFSQKGIEADDIIASILAKNSFEKKPILVSTDTDLYQLLNDCDMCIDLKKPLFTLKDFKKKYKIGYEHWVRVKSMAGDTADNISGISGVGISTAIKYIKGNVEYFSKVGKTIASRKTKDILEINEKLIQLPFDGTEEVLLQTEEVFDICDFLEVCDEYNFNTLTTKKGINEWKTIFNC